MSRRGWRPSAPQRHQQTKRAVLGAIRKYRLDDVAAHSPFVSFRRLMELALGAHVFLAPSVTASDGDAEGTPFVLHQMMATGMAAPSGSVPYLPIHAVQG